MVLRGPNIWTYKPVLEAWVDLGVLEDFPSNQLPGFPERLEAWLPSLIEHRCTIGERGGFLKRVHDGTWCGHILEHVTLELLSLCSRPAGFGRARDHNRRGYYKVVVSCPEETLTHACLNAAHALIRAAIDDQPFDVAARVSELKAIADTHTPALSDLPFSKENATNLPILFITGTHGRAEVARWANWLLRFGGYYAGLANVDGVSIDGIPWREGNGTSWRALRDLLDQDIDAAVCNVPPLTIVSEGIAFERCLVGLVTDIHEMSELVPYAMINPDQYYQVARCAVDLVLPQGVAVLNADDPQVVEMAKLCDGDVLFFGTSFENPVLAAHRAAGKRTVTVVDGQIVLATGDHIKPLGPLSAYRELADDGDEKPITTLAGVAAAWAMGVHGDMLAKVTVVESNYNLSADTSALSGDRSWK